MMTNMKTNVKNKRIKKLIISSDGRSFIWKGNDFHTQFGYISGKTMENAKPGSTVRTNTGKEFTVIQASFIDSYRRIRRGPQTMPLKDIGTIIAMAGIGKNSKVADAGAGSGAMACFLGNIAKSVATYEIRDDFAEIAEQNIRTLGLKNIKLKRKSIYDGIDEKKLDAVFLDLPEPWKAIKASADALVPGGFLVSYSPTIPQVIDFVTELKNHGFTEPEIFESIQRFWECDDRKTRPSSIPIGHSGFVVISRLFHKTENKKQKTENKKQDSKQDSNEDNKARD